ncbi:MAG: metallophosphoesterase [Phycisphaerae bacterium]
MRVWLSGVLAIVVWAAGARAENAPAPATRPTVHLLAIGDWGNGGKSQKEVARAMAGHVTAQRVAVDAMVMPGDNFYGKLADEKDKRWVRDFEAMYPVPQFGFPFYPVAGNHDYEKDKLKAELGYAKANPASRWKFAARWYRVDLPAGSDDPLVTLLMLDSNKDKLKKDWDAELKWLEYQLDKTPKLRNDGSRRWTVAVAHHPLFSNGNHGDNGVLQKSWGALFKRYGLDVFVGGHDHDLQHLEVTGWPISFVQAGGGGAGTREMRRDNRGPWSARANGFAHLEFSPEKLTVRFVDKSGKPLHAFERTGEGKVTVVQQGRTDGAPKKTWEQLKAAEARSAEEERLEAERAGKKKPKSDEDDD